MNIQKYLETVLSMPWNEGGASHVTEQKEDVKTRLVMVIQCQIRHLQERRFQKKIRMEEERKRG